MMLALSRDDISHSNFGLRLFSVFHIFISILVFFQTAKWLTHSIGELELNVNKVDSTMRRYHSYPIHPPCTYIVIIITHTYTTVHMLVFLQVSSGAEKVRRSRGGNISDGGFVRTSQHSASHALPLRLESIGMFSCRIIRAKRGKISLF